jgi:hypothetical protein
VRSTVGIAALITALLVGQRSPGVGRLDAEVLGRLQLASMSPSAALLVSAESFQTSTSNWIVVFRDASLACPAGMLMSGRINPCSASPVFRDVAYCVDQAHRTVLGERASLKNALGSRAVQIELPPGVKDVAELAECASGEKMFRACLFCAPSRFLQVQPVSRRKAVPTRRPPRPGQLASFLSNTRGCGPSLSAARMPSTLSGPSSIIGLCWKRPSRL